MVVLVASNLTKSILIFCRKPEYFLFVSADIDPVRSKTPSASADAQVHRTSNGVDIGLFCW